MWARLAVWCASLAALTALRLRIQPPHGNHSLLWCDTLECWMLMTPPVTYDVGRQKSPPFVYVPNDDLANKWGPDLEAYYKEPLRTGFQPPFNVNASSVPDFNVTHAYEGRLGRVMDVAMARAGPPEPLRMLEDVEARGPYTMYGNSEAVYRNRCLDHVGIYATNYFNYTSCMSLTHAHADDTAVFKYAGPVTWNRVNFTDSNHILRLLVTNGRVALPDRNTSFLSQRDFHSCPHSRHERDAPIDPHGYAGDTRPGDPGTCTTLFAISAYAHICCCPQGQCPAEVFTDVHRDRRIVDGLRYCPVGRISSRLPLTAQQFSLNEFERQAKGKLCQSVGTIKLVWDNEAKAGVNEIEIVLNATTHFAHHDYVHFLLSVTQQDHVCLSGQVRCPGRLADARVGERASTMTFEGTCYCSEGSCATIISRMFSVWNRFAAAMFSGRTATCRRRVLMAVRDQTPFCESHFDPLLGRTVAMEELNNYYVCKTVARLRHNATASLRLILVTVSQLVGEQCARADRVYGAPHRPRLLYNVKCRTPMCDQRFDDAFPGLVGGDPTLWPHCLSISTANHRLQRTADVLVDGARLRNTTEWLVSNQTGFCLMRFVSPDDDPSPIYLYEMRPVRPKEFEDLNCPDANRGELCVRQDSTFCCMPVFVTSEERKRRIISDMMQHIVDGIYADSASKILQQVQRPDSCVWTLNLNALSSVGCAHFRGCRREFLVRVERNEEESSCLSDLSAQVFQAEEQRRAVPPSALCALLNQTMGAYDLRRHCYLGENRADAAAPAHRVFCCCWSNEECGRLALGANLYYSDLLDQSNHRVLARLRAGL